MSNASPEHRSAFVDNMRVIAVVFVMASHTIYNLRDNGVSGIAISLLDSTVGQFGVSVFLLISGYLSARTLTHSSPRQFWIGRAARILPSLWVAWFAVGVSLTLINMATTIDAGNNFQRLITSSPLSENVDALGLLLTVTGLDGYTHISIWDRSTYLMTGEWFTGLLIIYLLLAPIIVKAVERFGFSFLAATGILAVMVEYPNLNGHILEPYRLTIWPSAEPTARLFEFSFGAFLHLSYPSHRFRRFFSKIAYTYVAVCITLYLALGLNLMAAGAVTYPFTCAVAILLLEKSERLTPPSARRHIEFIASISFMAMLIHHQIIRTAIKSIDYGSLNTAGIAALILSIVVISFKGGKILTPYATLISRVGLRSISRISR